MPKKTEPTVVESIETLNKTNALIRENSEKRDHYRVTMNAVVKAAADGEKANPSDYQAAHEAYQLFDAVMADLLDRKKAAERRIWAERLTEARKTVEDANTEVRSAGAALNKLIDDRLHASNSMWGSREEAYLGMAEFDKLLADARATSLIAQEKAQNAAREFDALAVEFNAQADYLGAAKIIHGKPYNIKAELSQ